MPITRAKATALLNQREMALYDDSRANAIRNLDQKALSTRITRAREARNRARDLVQRQKLSSRDRTGNKRGTSGLANQRSKDKVELTTDILRRFEAQLDKVADADATPRASAKAGRTPARKAASRRADRRDARKTTRGASRAPASGSVKNKTATTKKSSAKKSAGSTSRSTRPATRTAAKKSGTAKAGARKTGPTTAGAARSAAGKAGTGKAVTAKAGASRRGTKKTAKKAAKKTAARKSATRKLTPKQALKRTRALLEAKQARDREPKPWETLGGHGPDAAGQPGFQSGTAARRALELHAGESRMPAIKGSISTRDRINQGKRDHRGGD
jgi:hypothetical protein